MSENTVNAALRGMGYAWRPNPESKRAKEDRRLLVPIKVMAGKR